MTTKARSAARREIIVDRVRDKGYVGASLLADEFGVDSSTIRRDLAALERLGLVVRSHGGAVPAHEGREIPFEVKASASVVQKRAIGEAVAALVAPGSSLMLDSGSTALAVAESLHGRAGLTVVTHDLRVGAELARQVDVRVIVLGGEVVRHSYSVVSERSAADVAQYHVDVAIMAADGVDDQGFTITNAFEAALKRAMISGAQRVILAVDSSKVGVRELVRVAPLDAVDLLVTDDGAEEETLSRLPVEVLRVPTGDSA